MIPTQYKAIIGVTVLVMVAGVAYIKGRESGLEDLYAYKTEVETANAIIAEQNAERIRLAETNTAHVAELYAAHNDSVRRNLVSRLRQAKRDCAGMPAAPVATTESDGSTADHRPDPATDAPAETTYEAVCERLEKDCATTTLQTIWLQDWVARVCK